MKSIRSRHPSLVVVLGLAIILGPAAAAIVTSDTFGSHVLQDGVDLDVSASTGFLTLNVPDLDHDGVGQLRFFRSDLSNPDTFCSSALIVTPLGPAALTAAHCLADNSGQLVSSDFSLTVIDVFGTPATFTTNNPNNVKIHPNYDGTGWHGYDLALVFFDQPISVFITKYNVYDSSTIPSTSMLSKIIKMGFGRTGFGDGSATILDEQKRWGLNQYETFGFGDFGVPIPGGWNNTHLQLSMDFDDGTFIDHNLFNFYENFNGTVTAPSHFPIPGMRGGTLGFFEDEVLGANGDSGGPNFWYDEVNDRWLIVAVNSYVFRMPNNFGGFPGNSDFDNVFSFSWGEWEGDALVTDELVEQILGLAPAPPQSSPYGVPKIKGGFSESARGGHLTPWSGKLAR